MVTYFLAVQVGVIRNFVEVSEDEFFYVVNSVSNYYTVRKENSDFGSINYIADTDNGSVVLGYTM